MDSNNNHPNHASPTPDRRDAQIMIDGGASGQIASWYRGSPHLDLPAMTAAQWEAFRAEHAAEFDGCEPEPEAEP